MPLGLKTSLLRFLSGQPFGFQTFGHQPFGLEPFSFQTLRFDKFGLDAFGLDAFGLDAFGLDAFGLDAFGLDAFGLDAFGSMRCCLCLYGGEARRLQARLLGLFVFVAEVFGTEIEWRDFARRLGFVRIGPIEGLDRCRSARF